MQTLTDEERQLVIVLLMKQWVEIRTIGDMEREAKELEDIIRKISGTDKRVLISDN
jgi:hypothetical protein